MFHVPQFYASKMGLTVGRVKLGLVTDSHSRNQTFASRLNNSTIFHGEPAAPLSTKKKSKIEASRKAPSFRFGVARRLQHVFCGSVAKVRGILRSAMIASAKLPPRPLLPFTSTLSLSLLSHFVERERERERERDRQTDRLLV